MFLFDVDGPFVFKDPQDVTPYGVAWADWLAGETPDSFEWIVPAGLNKGTEAVSADYLATVYLGGGTLGAVVTVTSRCTTPTRVKDVSFRVRVVSQ